MFDWLQDPVLEVRRGLAEKLARTIARLQVPLDCLLSHCPAVPPCTFFSIPFIVFIAFAWQTPLMSVAPTLRQSIATIKPSVRLMVERIHPSHSVVPCCT